MKKIFLFVFVLFNIAVFSYSEVKKNTQVIQSGHWIYDDLYTIFTETKTSQFIENQPMTIGEIKFYFNDVDYENLSENGKKLYKKISDFLETNENYLKNNDLRLFMNAKVTPEIYYKSNENIPWTFNYNIKDFALTFPSIMGFADVVTIESDFFIGKNYISTQQNNNFHNIPLSGDDVEFLFPRFAYGNFGKNFDNWGFNFQIGKEGVTIGKTELGSIIYNKTFETDFYSQLNFYTKYYKYTMFVNQIDTETFLYLHQIDFRPFKNLRFSAIEGSLLNSPFELRYLNPLMIMHSFGSWEQHEYQMTNTEDFFYGEGHFCAYLGLSFDFVPIKNFRVYGLFAQTEILDLGGSRSERALSTPDGLGGQLGFDYNFHLDNGDYLKANLETVYTSPFLYVKQSPNWSMYKVREDMQAGGEISSWIGSPYGPDCFATKLTMTYQSSSKWQVSLGYLFKIHGENTAENMFKNTKLLHKKLLDENEEEEPDQDIYYYYPFARYRYYEQENDKEGMSRSAKEARYMWMSGIPEFTNQISLEGTYAINDHFNISGRFVYSFILNNKNIKDCFEQGPEISLAVQYKLF